MAYGLMNSPARSTRSPGSEPRSQAPVSGSAGSLRSFDPPARVPRMPAPPIMGPPVGGQPPMVSIPRFEFLPGPGMGPPVGGPPPMVGIPPMGIPPMAGFPNEPNLPFNPPGLPPGVGIAPQGPAGGLPQLPPGTDWARLMPFLQAMFG